MELRPGIAVSSREGPRLDSLGSDTFPKRPWVLPWGPGLQGAAVMPPLPLQFPSMKKTLEFKAHDGEIEDIALGPDNKVGVGWPPSPMGTAIL